jgi:Protein of unknown function (DUF2586)
MGQPKVTVNQANGALGRRAARLDGVAGLVLGAAALAAVAGYAALGTPFVVNSLPEAEGLGITAAYDATNQVRVHGTIADFFREGSGPELHVLLVPQATTLADMVDKTKLFGAKLLKDQGGRIKLLGLVRNPPAGASTTVQDGLDQDVVSALALAKDLVATEQAQYRYVSIVLEGRGFAGNTASVKDLRAIDGPLANRVSVLLGAEPTVSSIYPGYAAVGLLLGRLARIPVQRNAGRVKSGAVPVLTAGLSNGLNISSYTETQLDVLNDKGYIYLRKHVGVDGFYFNDDHTASPISDDFSGIARGRVLDKASTITRQVYVQELLDEIDVDPDSGRMQPAVIKSYQGAVETAIEREMQSQGEISGVQVDVDPDQNVLSTDRIETVVRITPKGVARQIVATLTYSNPSADTNA